jgi:hypothetical protein
MFFVDFNNTGSLLLSSLDCIQSGGGGLGPTVSTACRVTKSIERRLTKSSKSSSPKNDADMSCCLLLTDRDDKIFRLFLKKEHRLAACSLPSSLSLALTVGTVCVIETGGLAGSLVYSSSTEHVSSPSSPKEAPRRDSWGCRSGARAFQDSVSVFSIRELERMLRSG